MIVGLNITGLVISKMKTPSDIFERKQIGRGQVAVSDVIPQVTTTSFTIRIRIRHSFFPACFTVLLIKYLSESDCIWNDHDFVGGDLSSDSTRNAINCKKRCDACEECKKWTFLKSESSGKCYLKKKSHSIPRDFCEGCKTGFRDSVMQKCGLNGKVHCDYYEYNDFNPILIIFP